MRRCRYNADVYNARRIYGQSVKKKTAVIGDEKTYSFMLRQMSQARAIHHKGIGSRHAYSVNGIDYYCGMYDDYTGILRQRYDVIIQDISLNSAEDTFAKDCIKAVRM